MQKKLIALAIAGLASSAAFAQTNVQIYGIADMGYLYQSGEGGKNRHHLNSGVLSTSRIGFRGTEDLGNGLKALFTLEYGLLVDDNTGIGATSAVARQQFVGLSGGFGTVIAGRLQTTGLDFTVAGSALGGSTGIGATNNVGWTTGLVNAASRANNAIAYVSPTMGGVTVAVNHARLTETTAGGFASETPDNFANLASVSYANGGLTAGVVWAQTASRADGVNNDVKEWGLRAGYDFGVAKVQGAYQRLRQDDMQGSDHKYVLSVSAPIGAKVGVIGEYARAVYARDLGAPTDIDRKAMTLAATYSFSKRTTAYGGVLMTRLDQDAGTDLNVYTVGLRHSF